MQGLLYVSLAACLMSLTLAQPLFFGQPVSEAFIAAGSLLLAPELALIELLESRTAAQRSG